CLDVDGCLRGRDRAEDAVGGAIPDPARDRAGRARRGVFDLREEEAVMIRPMSLILLAGVAALLGGEAHRRPEQGKAEYLKGKNDAALEEYQKAQGVLPNSPQIHYDLGTVLYRQENWAGAAEAYEQALGAAGPDLAPKAAYNLGNALFQDRK